MADSDSEKTEKINFPRTKAAWPKFVKELKQKSYTPKLKNRWVVERDPLARARFKPAGLSAAKAFKDQMMMYLTLEAIFDDINPSLFEGVDFNQPNFATNIFIALDDIWKPEGYSDEAVLLDEYEQAFKFSGIPNPFFERISVIVKKLDKLGSKPNEKQTLKKTSDAITAFAMRSDASEADKTWGGWLQTFHQMERMAVRPITFDALRQAATIYYNEYVRMKGNEKL
mmetsp:Transcript_16839/g.40657  ORF Transcript_16839/g.40657 Transcript_16839/m.40657 type:complete len:227 (-) Transcript_16839:5524-6204(-)